MAHQLLSVPAQLHLPGYLGVNTPHAFRLPDIRGTIVPVPANHLQLVDRYVPPALRRQEPTSRYRNTSSFPLSQQHTSVISVIGYLPEWQRRDESGGITIRLKDGEIRSSIRHILHQHLATSSEVATMNVTAREQLAHTYSNAMLRYFASHNDGPGSATYYEDDRSAFLRHTMTRQTNDYCKTPAVWKNGVIPANIGEWARCEDRKKRGSADWRTKNALGNVLAVVEFKRWKVTGGMLGSLEAALSMMSNREAKLWYEHGCIMSDCPALMPGSELSVVADMLAQKWTEHHFHHTRRGALFDGEDAICTYLAESTIMDVSGAIMQLDGAASIPDEDRLTMQSVLLAYSIGMDGHVPDPGLYVDLGPAAFDPVQQQTAPGAEEEGHDGSQPGGNNNQPGANPVGGPIAGGPGGMNQQTEAVLGKRDTFHDSGDQKRDDAAVEKSKELEVVFREQFAPIYGELAVNASPVNNVKTAVTDDTSAVTIKIDEFIDQGRIWTVFRGRMSLPVGRGPGLETRPIKLEPVIQPIPTVTGTPPKTLRLADSYEALRLEAIRGISSEKRANAGANDQGTGSYSASDSLPALTHGDLTDSSPESSPAFSTFSSAGNSAEQSVVIKICNPHVRCDFMEEDDAGAFIEGVKREQRVYKEDLRDVQGDLVPRYYGLWEAASRVNWAPVGAKVYIAVMQDMGDSLDHSSYLWKMGPKEQQAAASAFRRLHSLGVYHGDARPANILLRPNVGEASGLRAVLIDFDRAKTVKDPEYSRYMGYEKRALEGSLEGFMVKADGSGGKSQMSATDAPDLEATPIGC